MHVSFQPAALFRNGTRGSAKILEGAGKLVQAGPETTAADLLRRASVARERTENALFRLQSQALPNATVDTQPVVAMAVTRTEHALRFLDEMLNARVLDGSIDLRADLAQTQRLLRASRRAANGAAWAGGSQRDTAAADVMRSLTRESEYRMPHFGRTYVHGSARA